MGAPLDGFRVVELAQGIAGPMAGMLLADFGAEVWKIEPLGGDPGRDEPGFAIWNRNKHSLILDLNAAADRDRLESLLAVADIAIVHEPIDRLRTRGLDPAALSARYQRLVILYTPPFTENPPWAGAAESAALVAAETGIAMAQYSFADAPVDSVYPHVLYGQAMWAAAATTAALVERETSGWGQTITVGGLHGMVATMSGRITHIPGEADPPRPLGAGGPVPFYRLYECADSRWLFMATLSPKFYLHAFDLLGLTKILADERLSGEPASMALSDNAPWVHARLQSAFRAHPRAEWLRRFREAGLPVGPVDPRDAWLNHEQIRAIGMRVEVEDPQRGPVIMPGISIHLTESPGAVRTAAPAPGANTETVLATLSPASPASDDRSPPHPNGPLEGVRVLDLGSIIAGTYAGSLLGELGADVVKVEPPGGDSLRSHAITFIGYNQRKRGVVLDLQREEGRAIFYDLVRCADVVVDNYRAGVLERLQIDYASLQKINPDIITVSVTGFGDGGPLGRDPGYDPVLQAMSGMMQAQGGDTDPVFFTLAVNDVSSAAMAALGACLALLHRQHGGGGQRVWTSLAGQAALMQSGELVRYQGRPPAILGDRDFLGPHPLDRFYRTRDGWIRLQAVNASRAGGVRPEEHAQALNALRNAGLLTNDGDPDNAALCDALAAAFLQRDRAEAVTQLGEARIPVSPARTISELSQQDSLFRETKALLAYEPSAGRSYYAAGRYAQFSRSARQDAIGPPGLGEHTEAVLAEAGYTPDRIAALLRDGVIVQGGPFTL